MKKYRFFILTKFFSYDMFIIPDGLEPEMASLWDGGVSSKPFTEIKFIGGFTMSKGECFVANAFVGVSKKTGREFYAVNVVIPDGDKYDVQMGFANKDVVDYVNKAGAGIYKYSIGFGGRIDGLEFVRKANL